MMVLSKEQWFLDFIPISTSLCVISAPGCMSHNTSLIVKLKTWLTSKWCSGKIASISLIWTIVSVGVTVERGGSGGCQIYTAGSLAFSFSGKTFSCVIGRRWESRVWLMHATTFLSPSVLGLLVSYKVKWSPVVETHFFISRIQCRPPSPFLILHAASFLITDWSFLSSWPVLSTKWPQYVTDKVEISLPTLPTQASTVLLFMAWIQHIAQTHFSTY